MDKKVFLSVVIPAFNEERLLPGTLNSIFGYLKKQSYSWEVVVSDDGSSDHTKDLVLEFQKSFPELILVDSPVNRGKGFAVNRGVKTAQGDLVVFMDADNSTKINEIEKVLPLFQGDIASATFDIVIASRRLKDSKITVFQPWYRRFLGEIFRIFTRVLFGFHYDDTQAGFKVFNQKARQVFDRQTVWRWGFDVELLWLAKKLGLSVKEIPIEWENHPNTHLKFLEAVNTIFELIRIRLIRYVN